MASIREFEHTLESPGDAGGRFSEEERQRLQQNSEEQERMRPIEGEVTPRFRHVEHQVQPQHQTEKQERNTGEKGGMLSGMSSLIDNDKVKLIKDKAHDASELMKEKGHDAKEAMEKAIGRGKSLGWMKWLLGLIGALLTLLAFAMLTMMFAQATLPYPSHASCEVNITFYNDQFLKTTPICESVKSAIVHQMKKWESSENCKAGGMKCLYKVTHVGDDELTGTHQTSDWFGFTDEMTFKFMDTPQGDCMVRAYSRSKFPLAYFDFSVNYCNIHNLVEGYGFEKFDEVTSDEVCTQYSTHDCEKY